MCLCFKDEIVRSKMVCHKLTVLTNNILKSQENIKIVIVW